jgi:valyl-tRNA synthetase
MDSRYDHSTHESSIYSLWEERGVFDPDRVKKNHPSPQKKSFSIIMPPPNANDPLHIGHAMFVALEDVLIRYHRMLGEDTVWIPGTDHAGIETQFVFEKKLAKQGKSRFDFDRDSLYKEISEYVQENSGVAIDQMKKLGASADWSRFCFTLDKPIIKTVLETFQHLHEEKLVYRDLRLVNFCTKCGTSYSELEVNHEDRTSPLYYIRYYFVDNPEEYLVVATVRPEPIFADTHLAVHPKDKTKQHLIGRQVRNPLTTAVMEILADEFVDPTFGTGIVKLTPAHDHNDFEVAKKLQLPMHQAITTQGKITTEGGKYAGLSIVEARKQVIADLETTGHIEKIDATYQNRVGVCYRCGRVIEPLPLPQFFISVSKLSQRALKTIEEGKLVVHGAGREKILQHWLKNLRDWNISRQIVWGIRIPAWYNCENPEGFFIKYIDSSGKNHQGMLADLLLEASFEEILVGLQQVIAPKDSPYIIATAAPQAKGRWLQETDTFDTWFSSGQWPFATLKNTKPGDFERFYPTQVMETGYDILPFWVMRMLLLGLFETDVVPFKEVYLHGLVRDDQGKKMSKSKGNVTNPLAIIASHGADALRMALVIRSTPGGDKSVGAQDFKAMRNLTNKLWNAARFVLLKVQEGGLVDDAKKNTLSPTFTTELNRVVAEVSQNLSTLKIGLAGDIVVTKFWHWYCDTQIEEHKNGTLSLHELLDGLLVFLRLLHPFMPFVTEAIWQELQNSDIATPTTTLAIAPWPTSEPIVASSKQK